LLGVEELRVGVAASEAPPFETVVDEQRRQATIGVRGDRR
jgi:hypothetical protein